jgi:hypothetical protein
MSSLLDRAISSNALLKKHFLVLRSVMQGLRAADAFPCNPSHQRIFLGSSEPSVAAATSMLTRF